AGNCSSTGATVTNTGTVASLGSSVICAVVSVPAGYAAGTNDLYFRTGSANSGAADTIHDAVTVNAVRSISVTPNQAGQTYPGGSYVYTQTLINTGNVTEGNGSVSSIAFNAANNQGGWIATLYYDGNNNGTLDATDPQITGNLNTVSGLAGGLAPGQSITVFVKVIAPSGAVVGAVDTTTVTVTTTNGSDVTAAPAAAVATDSTTVIAGNLTLSKAQALDAACTGPTGGTTYAHAGESVGRATGGTGARSIQRLRLAQGQIARDHGGAVGSHRRRRRRGHIAAVGGRDRDGGRIHGTDHCTARGDHLDEDGDRLSGREAAGQPRHGVEIAGDLRVGRVEGAVIVAVVVERRYPAALVVRGVERD